MYNITSNADRVSRAIRTRLNRMRAALLSVFKSSLIKINTLALDKLSGSNSAEPGSYPVPNRTGNLFRSQNWSLGSSGRIGYVFNRARYAVDVHEGAGGSKKYGRRPFLDDAVEEADVLGGHQRALRRSALA